LQTKSFLNEITFDRQGLVPAVIQDAKTDRLLMVAYMNRQSLLRTLVTGKTHFWSRSRRKLWCKGETSGYTQRIRSICLDCDGDALLIKVKQKTAACHTGYYSCFFRKLDRKGKAWKVVGRKMFSPKVVYKRKLKKNVLSRKRRIYQKG